VCSKLLFFTLESKKLFSVSSGLPSIVSGIKKVPVETSEGYLTIKNPFFSLVAKQGDLSMNVIFLMSPISVISLSSLSSLTHVRLGRCFNYMAALSLTGVCIEYTCSVSVGYKQSLMSLNTSSS